jgi:hypothetical protein
MKNLILTSVLVLTSLISFSQMVYSVDDVPQLDQTQPDDTLYITSPSVNISVTSINGVSTGQFSIDHCEKGTYTAIFSTNPNYNNNVLLDVNFTYVFDNNVDGVYSLTILDTTTALLSVNDKQIEITGLTAYPNPTISDIMINFNTNTIKTPVYVFSLTGQLVMVDDSDKNVGENRIPLNVSNFASGMYLIKVGKEVFKFIKVK